MYETDLYLLREHDSLRQVICSTIDMALQQVLRPGAERLRGYTSLNHATHYATALCN